LSLRVFANLNSSFWLSGLLLYPLMEKIRRDNYAVANTDSGEPVFFCQPVSAIPAYTKNALDIVYGIKSRNCVFMDRMQ
jgi:hypothetical protein